MKQIILLFLLLGVAFGQLPNNDIDLGPTSRILDGGPRFENQKQLPIDVLGESNGSIYCNYIPINEFWGLTVAHCVFGAEPSSIWVGSGSLEYPLRTNREGIPLKNIYIHEGYNHNTLENDIALLELEERNPFTEFPKVIDVNIPETLEKGVAQICGWGNTARKGFDVDYPDRLQCGLANIFEDEPCQIRIGRFFHPSMICVDEMLIDGFSGADSGDSGGLLSITNSDGVHIAGLISRGVVEDYGGNTELIYYLDWINSILAANKQDPMGVYEPSQQTDSGTNEPNEPAPETDGIMIDNFQENLNLIMTLLQTLVPIIAFLFFAFRLGIPWVEAIRKGLKVRTWQQLADELVRHEEIRKHNGDISTGKEAHNNVKRELVTKGCGESDAECHTNAAFKRMLESEKVGHLKRQNEVYATSTGAG